MSAPDAPSAGQAVADWIAGDPDPVTRAELAALPAAEAAKRMREPLTFGTAGLRGPVQAGPSGMNVAVVIRTTAALARYLTSACLGGSEVIVGRDGRTGSEEFALAAAEVLAAAGFRVCLLPRPLPTPIVAFAVRSRGAAAGVQITASHNPAPDNGYKLYLAGGTQLVSPADREIEALIAQVGPAAAVPRSPVTPTDDTIAQAYLDRIASLPRTPPSVRTTRIALTALHGVGGAIAVEALRRAGFTDVVTVAEQFNPDPRFPTVSFPNPEEPGATDLLLAAAERADADLAIALDPDADRCAVGVRRDGKWTMLTGDQTGALLAQYVLANTESPDPLVATTLVSSTLLGSLAPARGARYARTLTGFKWLARAGEGLVYAYEEAIGHCVDPTAVRDKDGISAAIVLADLTAALAAQGRTPSDVLDDLAVEFGLHVGAQVSLRVESTSEIARMMSTLRAAPPSTLSGQAVLVTNHLRTRGPLQTDALELNLESPGAVAPSARVVVRPSGTEPKLKAYLEVVVPITDRDDLPRGQRIADKLLDQLTIFARSLPHYRGPN